MTFIPPGKSFCGSIFLGGDKSISHRLVLMSLLHHGFFSIKNLSAGEDVKTSLKIIETLGCQIELHPGNVTKIKGASGNLRQITIPLDCGNSGTTARLLAGILAGLSGTYGLIGDASLSGRPMKRVIEPLSQMGAEFTTEDFKLPIQIRGKHPLAPINYEMPIASAQVKSSILFAATNSHGPSFIKEPYCSRDHSEKLFAFLGAKIITRQNEIEFTGPFRSTGDYEFQVPGDISSAAFVIVAATLLPDCDVVLKDILLNEKRISFIEVLTKMGADISLEPKQNNLEPMGNIRVRSRKNLKAVDLFAADIPGLIDELPALAVAMAFAEGISTISGASELRVKESDRISNLCREFLKAGIKITELQDGYRIQGEKTVSFTGTLNAKLDHRLAAAFSILAMTSKDGFSIDNIDCIRVSFPEFQGTFLEAFSNGL